MYFNVILEVSFRIGDAMTVEEKKQLIGGVLVFLVLYLVTFGNILKQFDYIDAVYFLIVVVYLFKFLHNKLKK